MMHPPSLPPDPRVLITGASRGQAIAYAHTEEFSPGTWAFVETTGPSRVYAVDEAASAEAQGMNPLRPSEALEDQRVEVIEALRRLGVVRAWVFGLVARSADTGESDIALVVTFFESPRGLAWAGRMAEIENVVYGLTGFPCDAIEDRGSQAERLAPADERVELFDDRA